MSGLHLRVIDPPWDADTGGGGRGAQNHYGLADAGSIAGIIRRSPGWTDVDPMLAFVWSTVGALHTGDLFALVGDLGLRVCAGFVWAKVDPIGGPALPARCGDGAPQAHRPHPGVGHLQLARIDRAHLLRRPTKQLDLFEAPRAPKRRKR